MALITCVQADKFKDTKYNRNLTLHNSALFPREKWPDADHPLKPLFTCAVDKERCDELENDPSFLQIIPYLVLRREDGKFLYYTRQGQEERLHKKISIGIGGHVQLNLQDVASFSTSLRYELLREAQEELGEEVYRKVQWDSLKPVGLVRHTEDAVGSVHLGIVYCATIDADDITEVSAECGELKFGDHNELSAAGELEPWSLIALRNIETVTRVDKAIVSQANSFTGIRVVGSANAFIVPERDMAIQVAATMESVVDILTDDLWPAAHDLLRVTDAHYDENVIDVMQSIYAMIELAVNPKPHANTYIQTLEAAGFFELSVESRLGVLSHIGLTMLGHLWVSLRQYVSAGHDPAEQYALVFKAAGDVINQALGSKDGTHAAAEFAVRKAKKSGIDRAAFLRLVEEAYDKE